MTIAPINVGEILNSVGKNISSENDSESFIPFQDILSDALDRVVETDNAVQLDALNIAAGKTDDLHTLTIDIAKADLALQTYIQVRNKALDAYNEIMRITV